MKIICQAGNIPPAQRPVYQRIAENQTFGFVKITDFRRRCVGKSRQLADDLPQGYRAQVNFLLPFTIGIDFKRLDRKSVV